MGPAPALIILYVETQDVPAQILLPDPLFQQIVHIIFRAVLFQFHRILVIFPCFVFHAVIPFPVMHLLQLFRQGRERVRILHNQTAVIGDDTDLPLGRPVLLLLLLHADLRQNIRRRFRKTGQCRA